jgi:hypothetical protein
MSDVFISYANEDREQAKALAAALEQEGVTVWWDRKIPFGKDFDKVIEKALSEAKCVLVLWTHSSAQSRWVRAEASDAAGREVMLPVLLEHDVKIPLEFRALQAADLRDWQGEPQHAEFQALLAHAKRMLASSVSTPHAARPDKAQHENDTTRVAHMPVHALRGRKVRHLLAYILIPTILLAAAVVSAKVWRVPTWLQLDVVAERVAFTLAGDRSVAVPSRALNFHTLSIENFERVGFTAERVAVERAPGLRTSPGDIVLNAGSGKRSVLVLEPTNDSGRGASVGRLQPIMAKPRAMVVLESRSGGPLGLTLRLEGQPLDTQILPLGRFALSASPVTIAGGGGGQPGALSMQAALPEHSPHISVRGTRRDFVITARHTASSGVELVGSAPISGISFLKANASGVPVSSLTGRGEISYPHHPHLASMKLSPGEVLDLQDIRSARVSDVSLQPEGRGIALRVEAVVHTGHLSSNGVTRDLRASVFDARRQRWQGAGLLLAAAWALSISTGAYRLYRDFASA